MNFGKKDREFIMKIANKLDKIENDFGIRLDVVEELKNVEEGKKGGPEIKKGYTGLIDGPNNIQVKFEDNNLNELSKKILIESIYETIQETCYTNNISNLSININEI